MVWILLASFSEVPYYEQLKTLRKVFPIGRTTSHRNSDATDDEYSYSMTFEATKRPHGHFRGYI